MSVQKLVDDFFKEKFPIEDSAPKAAPQEKVMDIDEFDDLIDVYRDAQSFGTSKNRSDARRALKEAYRAALRAAGKDDR